MRYPDIQLQKCVGCNSCARACPRGVVLPGVDHPQIDRGKTCIECMHCAAVCRSQAISFSGISALELYGTKPDDSLEQLIMTRRSIRHFKETLPQKEDIEQALHTSVWAPSGKNMHANGWTVIWGLKNTEALTQKALQWCRETGEAPELISSMKRGINLLTCDAPCVILGWSPADVLNPVVDTVIATTTAELILCSKGLSTCWGGYLNQLANSSEEIRSLLGINRDIKVICALMVGYADKELYHYVPYRPAPKVIWNSTDA